MEEKKEKLKKREYLYITLFALFCPISIWSLASSITKIRVDALVYSGGHLLTILGVIVSTVGMAITVYFIVLAVSANKIRKEIDDIENKINNTQTKHDTLEKNQNVLETKIRDNRKEIDENIRKIQDDKQEIDDDVRKIQADKQEIDEYTQKIDKFMSDWDKKFKWAEEILYNNAQTLYETLDEQIGELENEK